MTGTNNFFKWQITLWWGLLLCGQSCNKMIGSGGKSEWWVNVIVFLYEVDLPSN